MCSWQPPTASAAMSNILLTIVHGRCIRCAPRFQLGKFNFLDAFDGWAEGFVMTVSNGHISQFGTILHTTDGGKIWKPLTGVETYGVEVEPAFSFINSRQGWVAWPRPDGDDRMIRTEDGGRNWRNIHWRLKGMPVHLRFFDSRFGVAALSTAHGAQIAITTNGGATWKDQPADLAYPDVLLFLNRSIGWLGGTVPDTPVVTPRLFLTTNGG